MLQISAINLSQSNMNQNILVKLPANHKYAEKFFIGSSTDIVIYFFQVLILLQLHDYCKLNIFFSFYFWDTWNRESDLFYFLLCVTYICFLKPRATLSHSIIRWKQFKIKINAPYIIIIQGKIDHIKSIRHDETWDKSCQVPKVKTHNPTSHQTIHHHFNISS